MRTVVSAALYAVEHCTVQELGAPTLPTAENLHRTLQSPFVSAILHPQSQTSSACGVL